MKDIIIKKSVPENTVSDWVSAISFIPTPTDDMLDSASELLQSTNFNHHVVLSMSSLMHTYCEMHFNCFENNAGVYSGVQFLEKAVMDFYQQNITRRTVHDDVCITLKLWLNIPY